MSCSLEFQEWLWWFQSTRVLGLNPDQYHSIWLSAYKGRPASWWYLNVRWGRRQDTKENQTVPFVMCRVRPFRNTIAPTPINVVVKADKIDALRRLESIYAKETV